MSEAIIEQAIAYHRRNELDRALRLYEEVLASDPDEPRALYYSATIHFARRDVAVAVSRLRQVLSLRPDAVEARCFLAHVERTRGRFDEAVAYYEQALVHAPGSRRIVTLIGDCHLQSGSLEAALERYEQALRLPGEGAAAVWSGLLAALTGLGRHVEAIERSRAVEPAMLDQNALLNLAYCYYHLQRYRPCLAFIDASGLDRRLPAVLELAGQCHVALFERDAAIRCFEDLIAVSPPGTPSPINGLGLAYKAFSELDKAVEVFTQGITVAPDFVPFHINRGNTWLLLDQLQEAEVDYRRALSLAPDDETALVNLGRLRHRLGDYEEAIDCFSRAIESPSGGRPSLWLNLLISKGYLCDWSDYPEIRERLAGLDPETLSREDVLAVDPFALLGIFDDPAMHLAWARCQARHRFLLPVDDGPGGPGRHRTAGDRIHVAYVSSDVFEHPTMYLAIGLFERYDRDRFEVTLLSHGQVDESSPYRRRARAGVDHFIDITPMDDEAVVQLIADTGVDILVDLKGYTAHHRSSIFRRRVAAFHLQFLGYPGTLGSDCYDYIVADRHLIGDDDRIHYAEDILYLPDSYQPNDDRRHEPRLVTSRADHGLPGDGVVFCCFNNAYKITPETFALWMRILGQTGDSVLWLLHRNDAVSARLREACARHGIDPARIVFAERAPMEDHLDRLGHADLFLDTFPYNAHTTASDALWAGVPVVTKAGRSFASRVGESLLAAVGLEQLACRDDETYLRLAVDLYRDRPRLATLRDHLTTNRRRLPLFDTGRFVANLESVYHGLMR